MSAEAGRIAVSLKRADFTLDADISLPSQGITGVLGASGCGKTSLLRCVAGLESSARGIVRVNGETWQGPDGFLPAWKRSVGYVFQDARLFPHLTVSKNIEYGRRRASALPGQGSYDDIVALLGIAHLLNRRPATLSAGEGQRVAIARALLRYPSVILMDEPLANLDDARRQEIMPFLARLHASLRVPMLYVSHSVDEIARLCDQLVVMQSGKVVGQGRLQDMLTRAGLPGLGGKEASVVLDARVRHYDAEYELCSFAIDQAGTEVVVPGWHGEVGAPVRLRVMAADVSVCLERPARSSILNILEAVVVAVRPEPGGYVLVSLRIGEAAMLARITSRSAQRLGLVPGSQLFAQIKGVSVRNPAG